MTASAPSTAAELVQAIERGRSAEERLFAELGARAEEPMGNAEWAPKQVLAHHTMWIEATLATLGVRDLGHEWRGQDEENAAAAERAAHMPLSAVREEFGRRCDELVAAIRTMSDEDLNTPGRISYAPDETLAQVIRVNTFPHWEEHAREIRAWAGLA